MRVDAHGVPRSPACSSFDEDEEIQCDYEMQEFEREQQPVPKDYDQPEPDPSDVALGNETVANDEGSVPTSRFPGAMEDIYGVPRSPNYSGDINEAVQDDLAPEAVYHANRRNKRNRDAPGKQQLACKSRRTVREDDGMEDCPSRTCLTLRQPSDDVILDPAWEQKRRQNRRRRHRQQRHINRDNSRQSDSTLDTDDGLETSSVPPTRKRKTRAQLEKTPDWMPAFMPAIMTALGESGSALSDRDIKDVIHKVLDSMPGEGQQQPSIEDVMRELIKSRDCVPSCIDACHTVHKIVGHLVRDDTISHPFNDGTEARTKAECDNVKLEAAWRVVGHMMDKQFAVARTIFQNSIFNRASGELPFQLGDLLAQSTPNSLTIR